MQRKLWAEAREIADRHTRGNGEDLAQDLVVAALEAEGVENVGAWMDRVGRNAAIDRWRSEGRRGELLKEIELPSTPMDPESVLLTRERRSAVRRALVGLPRGQRRAALARFHGDLSYEEVAARVAIPVATARTRVHRALAVLRSRLQGLRGLVLVPGAHATAALGVALVVSNGPVLLPAPRMVADVTASSLPARSPHFARARVIAAADLSPPLARPTAPKPAGPPPLPPPTQTFTFGDEEVEGEHVGPDLDRVVVVRPAPEPSLIEIRRHFVAEMMKTLEDLE